MGSLLWSPLYLTFALALDRQIDYVKIGFLAWGRWHQPSKFDSSSAPLFKPSSNFSLQTAWITTHTTEYWCQSENLVTFPNFTFGRTLMLSVIRYSALLQWCSYKESAKRNVCVWVCARSKTRTPDDYFSSDSQAPLTPPSPYSPSCEVTPLES